MKQTWGSVAPLVLTLLFAANSHPSAQSIQVEIDAGYFNVDTVITETPVIFMLRYTNPDTLQSWSISNGFRIYSPDGAVWRGPSFVDTLSGVIPASDFDLGFVTSVFHGISADTFGIFGAVYHGVGFPPNFDGFPYAIRIGGFEPSNMGLHVCIDSSWFRPGGSWKWMSKGLQTQIPAWNGPYCYTIYDRRCRQLRVAPLAPMHCGCCVWTTGNVDGDPLDIVDISDIFALADFLTSSLPLSDCPTENNVDVSGNVDISDLMMLIDNLTSDIPLPPCPHVP